MKIYSIETGNFKLDGGAMFGVVPKSLWNRKHPADENNMCSWQMRCLLIEKDNRLILIDNGIGTKQDEKFLSYYHLHGSTNLVSSIRKLGFEPEDITDNILTHLHFDHCGGSIKWNNDRTKFEPTFKNARYYTSKVHWDWAIYPNAREKASFLKDNLLPLQDLGVLDFIEDGYFIPELELKSVSGHTEKMFIPILDYKSQKIIYGADLFPSHHHIPLPWVMAYDMQPLKSLTEKETFLNYAIENNALLMFEHDYDVELCSLEKTDRGIIFKETLILSDLR